MIHKLTNSQRSLLCYYKRSRRYMALGLTSRGLPRQRKLLSEPEDRKRRLMRWRARSAQRTAMGLTTRGTPRKQRDRRTKYRAWLEFRAEVTIPPTWDEILGLDGPRNTKRMAA